MARWGSYRTVETRDRWSRDLCSRSRSAAALNPGSSAVTHTRARPPPIEDAQCLPDAADVAHRPSLAGIEHLVDPT